MANVALLQGKKVLVTGAARGLGRDFAQAIAEAGAPVSYTHLTLPTSPHV